MNLWAYPDPVDCPSLEEIAAYLDRALGDEERQRLVEHFADCEACRELVAEATRTRRSMAPPSGAVRLARSWRRRLRPRRVAAALLVLVAGAAAWVVLRPPPNVELGELAAALADGHGLTETHWRRTVLRAATQPDLLSRRSFRLGVLLLDHRLCVAASDTVCAGELRRRLSDERAALGQYGRAATRAATLGDTRGEAWLSELESDLPDPLSPELVSLGAWTEAGWLAASVGNTSFFTDSNRRFASRICRRPPDALPVVARVALATVLAAWDDIPDAAALDRVAATLQAILQAMEG